MLFPAPGGPRRTHHRPDLNTFERTVGGHKIDQKHYALMYAVYTDGSPAGIIGRVWRHGKYMDHKWTDEGVSQFAEREPGYNLPFAPTLAPTKKERTGEPQKGGQVSSELKPGLHFGSYADVLQGLPDGSINLWVVDSPYGNTDLAFDKQPVDWQGEFWPLVRRKSAPNAVVVCFACETFTLDLIASNREWYRYRMVWAKSRASRPLDAGWRPLCNHEDLAVFSPAIKAATYNPQRLQTNRNVGRVKRKSDKFGQYKAVRGGEYNDTGLREPTSVLDFGSVPTMAPHFNRTAKPVALVQYLIETFSNRGDNVAEPFAGDAPAAHACQNTGRTYWGAEINLEQYEYSQVQLANKSPLFAAPSTTNKGGQPA